MTSKLPATLTPMLAQYLEIKRRHPDSILFYRMGDFYEMFFDDAIIAAPILEVQLTSRDKSSANPIPMCGIPHHAATQYLQKLIARGLKVALCEQVEDPSTAKGLVKRDVLRVVTPSLVGDPDLVPAETRNILIALRETGDEIEVCALDLLGGEVRAGIVDRHELLTELFCELLPKEILVDEETAGRAWLRDLLRFFPSIAVTKRAVYFVNATASQAVEHYLKETQKIERVPHLQSPRPLFEAQTMKLDATTLSSLEIIRGASPGGATLADVLDRTQTPMGRRLLREWLVHPLLGRLATEERHEAVDNFRAEPALASALRDALSPVRDLERLTTKTALGLAHPRDLVAVRSILERLPEIKKRLKSAKAPWLKARGERLDPLPKVFKKLDAALLDEAPATLREGGIFKESFHEEIAEYRTLSRDAKGLIAAMETRERERTGISSLKLKYSRVFGYTIEITKSHLGKVPDDYVRKQTIANGERYVTPELKKFEEKVVTADERLRRLEENLFLELREEIGQHAAKLLADARILAELDVLLGFATVADERGYVRPRLHDGDQLLVREGRHPVIETILSPGAFVPNSIELSHHDCRTLLITGPNMAGKSTVMRQVALISLMAQAGSFVPAAEAHLPMIDAIYTRIGASDDLTRGRSTFMVEMSEVARILEKATSSSLVLIDEIGRGTSTYDGLSLAWAILEHLHVTVGAKTLFATHFHELTQLEKQLPQLRNASVLVEHSDDTRGPTIVFLHKLVGGICNRSYGVEVAKLAGLPPKVLLRAKDILGVLETQSQRGARTRHKALQWPDNQPILFEAEELMESRDSQGP